VYSRDTGRGNSRDGEREVLRLLRSPKPWPRCGLRAAGGGRTRARSAASARTPSRLSRAPLRRSRPTSPTRSCRPMASTTKHAPPALSPLPCQRAQPRRAPARPTRTQPPPVPARTAAPQPRGRGRLCAPVQSRPRIRAVPARWRRGDAAPAVQEGAGGPENPIDRGPGDVQVPDPRALPAVPHWSNRASHTGQSLLNWSTLTARARGRPPARPRGLSAPPPRAGPSSRRRAGL